MTRRRTRTTAKALVVLTAATIAAIAGLTTLDNPFATGPLTPQASTPATAALEQAGLTTLTDNRTVYNVDVAAAALAAVPSAEPTKADSYDSTQFGSRWKDVDRNGCDTRNDLLARDLTDTTFKAGTNNCKVTSGVLIDPYSGNRFELATGTLSTAVQADHVIPKAWSWRQGAASWPDGSLRIAFANDLDNLQMVTSSLNGSKSDSGPAGWMPPAASYRCEYTFRWVYLLGKYPLTINDADRQALSGNIAACEDAA